MIKQNKKFRKRLIVILSIALIYPLTQQAFGQSCAEPAVTGITYTTIADGNWNSPSVWSGGVVPSFNVGSNNKVVIMHEIDRNSSSDFFPSANSVLIIKSGGSLTTEQIQMENTSKIIINKGKLHVDHGNFQVKTSSASVCAYQACIIIDENFQFEETGTNMTFNNTGIQIDNGNLQSKSNVSGSDIRLWLKNGNLQRSGGSWTAASITYRRVSGSVDGFTGIVAQSSSATISDKITPCDDEPVIEANNDNYTATVINGITGRATVGNVLTNDLHNSSPATTSLVNINIVTAATPPYTGGNVPAVNATTGVVSVPANTISGSYTITYSICDAATGSPCDTAIVSLAIFNPIKALDNNYSVSAGVTTTSILLNDSLGGKVVNPASITTTPITTVPTGFTLNADGTVSVASTVTSGTYSFAYRICEKGAAPINCDDATVTLHVLNPIVANDNTYNTTPGNTTTSILTNDSLNGVPISIEKITVSVASQMPTGFTLNPDGTVSIESTVPFGNYNFDYEICETGATPPNCNIATVTILMDEPMPVNMLYFNIAKDNNSALLEWATANETNNRGFDIEKSQNGRDWTKIGFVQTKAANGNSSTQLNYHYNDNNPSDGINYYRLKQQDVDGKFDYSVVKQLTFVAGRIIKLYPNPAMDYVIIEGLDGTEELRLIDVKGRIMKTENATATKAKIELNNIAAGSYQIQVCKNGRIISTYRLQKTL